MTACTELPNMTTVDMTRKPGESEKLEMTPQEMNRFKECMKDPNFIELWNDYAKDISDPKHLKEQEEYLKQVEAEAKQAGDSSFTFIFPKPNFCVKLQTADKDNRFYINVCDDEKVQEPSEETTGDRGASQWQVPVCVGKIRDEVFNDKDVKVVDACYHPKATYLARDSERFMVFLVDIAVENINHTYLKELPRGKPLPMEFSRLPSPPSIGNPAAQTIRIAAVKGKEGELVIEPKKRPPTREDAERSAKHAFKTDESFADRLAASMGNDGAKRKIAAQKQALRRAEEERAEQARRAADEKKEAEAKAAAAFKRNLAKGFAGDKGGAAAPAPKKSGSMPPYTVVEVGSIEYSDCWNSTERPEKKLPKLLKVLITLENGARASDLDMQIEDRHVFLKSEKFGIDGTISLPYAVDADKTKAKYDVAKKVLTVQAPVLQQASDFELQYKREQAEKRRQFAEESARQAAEEAAEQAAEDRKRHEEAQQALKEERQKEDAERARKEEAQLLLEKAAEAERLRRDREKQAREEELRKKELAALEKKLTQLEATKASIHEQEAELRRSAEEDHAKMLRKIKKELEAAKLDEVVQLESNRKQQELPFTNRYIFELD